MLCNNCGNNEANTHITESINGQTKEYYLCFECAQKLGYSKIINPFDINFNGFLGSMFSSPAPQKKLPETKTEVCPFCGASFEDLAETGKAGCAVCYKTFCDSLAPSIQRIHGKAVHTGKVPKTAGKDLKKKHEIKALTDQLNAAVANQEYEKAAELRDKINQLKVDS